jgi:hypothetical protein
MKIVQPRTIKGKEFVKDMRCGMSDLDLAKKYRLTEPDFDRVLEYLVDAGLITEQELQERQQLPGNSIVRTFIESWQSTQLVD